MSSLCSALLRTFKDICIIILTSSFLCFIFLCFVFLFHFANLFTLKLRNPFEMNVMCAITTSNKQYQFMSRVNARSNTHTRSPFGCASIMLILFRAHNVLFTCSLCYAILVALCIFPSRTLLYFGWLECFFFRFCIAIFQCSVHSLECLHSSYLLFNQIWMLLLLSCLYVQLYSQVCVHVCEYFEVTLNELGGLIFRI